MKTIELDQANRSLAEYARMVGDEPVVLTVDGKPFAALFSLTDADLETFSLSTNPDFIALVEQARHRIQDEGGISAEDMRLRLGL